jgi:hypothetical protein
MDGSDQKPVRSEPPLRRELRKKVQQWRGRGLSHTEVRERMRRYQDRRLENTLAARRDRAEDRAEYRKEEVEMKLDQIARETANADFPLKGFDALNDRFSAIATKSWEDKQRRERWYAERAEVARSALEDPKLRIPEAKRDDGDDDTDVEAIVPRDDNGRWLGPAISVQLPAKLQWKACPCVPLELWPGVRVSDDGAFVVFLSMWDRATTQAVRFKDGLDIVGEDHETRAMYLVYLRAVAVAQALIARGEDGEHHLHQIVQRGRKVAERIVADERTGVSNLIHEPQDPRAEVEGCDSTSLPIPPRATQAREIERVGLELVNKENPSDRDVYRAVSGEWARMRRMGQDDPRDWPSGLPVKLPSEETFKRYLREYRRLTGTQKQEQWPKAARTHGLLESRNVCRPEELDPN